MTKSKAKASKLKEPKIKKVNPTIKRKTLLKEARFAFDQFRTWKERDSYNSLTNAIKYQAQTEILIELLEEDDCGSVGGFDTARGQDRNKAWTLEARLEWLEKLK